MRIAVSSTLFLWLFWYFKNIFWKDFQNIFVFLLLNGTPLKCRFVEIQNHRNCSSQPQKLGDGKWWIQWIQRAQVPNLKIFKPVTAVSQRLIIKYVHLSDGANASGCNDISSGCHLWVLCGGKCRWTTRISRASSINSRFLVWLPFLSRWRRTSFLSLGFEISIKLWTHFRQICYCVRPLDVIISRVSSGILSSRCLFLLARGNANIFGMIPRGTQANHSASKTPLSAGEKLPILSLSPQSKYFSMLAVYSRNSSFVSIINGIWSELVFVVQRR